MTIKTIKKRTVVEEEELKKLKEKESKKQALTNLEKIRLFHLEIKHENSIT